MNDLNIYSIWYYKRINVFYFWFINAKIMQIFVFIEFKWRKTTKSNGIYLNTISTNKLILNLFNFKSNDIILWYLKYYW